MTVFLLYGNNLMIDFVREMKIKYYAWRICRVGFESPHFAGLFDAMTHEIKSRSKRQIAKMEKKAGLL